MLVIVVRSVHVFSSASVSGCNRWGGLWGWGFSLGVLHGISNRNIDFLAGQTAFARRTNR